MSSDPNTQTNEFTPPKKKGRVTTNIPNSYLSPESALCAVRDPTSTESIIAGVEFFLSFKIWPAEEKPVADKVREDIQYLADLVSKWHSQWYPEKDITSLIPEYTSPTGLCFEERPTIEDVLPLYFTNIDHYPDLEDELEIEDLAKALLLWGKKDLHSDTVSHQRLIHAAVEKSVLGRRRAARIKLGINQYCLHHIAKQYRLDPDIVSYFKTIHTEFLELETVTELKEIELFITIKWTGYFKSYHSAVWNRQNLKFKHWKRESAEQTVVKEEPEE